MERLKILGLVLLLVAVLIVGACAKPAPTTPAPTTPVTTTPPTTTPATKPPATTPAVTTPAPTTKPAVQSAADFYKANVVTLVTPTTPGGGTDYAARMISSYWGTFTGGAARVENLPGGGNLSGINHVYNAKPDGLIIGVGDRGVGLMPAVILGLAGVQYDITKFEWIGMFGEVRHQLFVKVGGPYQSIQDLKNSKKTVILGASGITAAPGIGDCVVAEVLKLNAKVAAGYEGSAETAVALTKGEIDAYVGTILSSQAYVTQGMIKPLFALGTKPDGAYPDLPIITKLVQLAPEDEHLVELFMTAFLTEKVIYVPPGVPADRVQFLRATFDKMVADKSFVDMGKMKFQPWTKPISGVDASADIRGTMAKITPADIARVKQMIDKYTKLG